MNLTRLPAAVAPVVVAGVAFALWLISDRLLYVGPLDRGTFAALVVIPLWAIAPGIAIVWRDVDPAVIKRRSAVAGLVVGAAIAAFLWSDETSVDCRPAHAPLDLVLPAVVFGAVVGGGFGLACRLAAGQAAGEHPWRGIATSLILQLAILAVVPMLQLTLFFGLCQRP